MCVSICTIEDDNLHEGNETFAVYISSPNDDDAVILTSSSLTIVIQDDDGKNDLRVIVYNFGHSVHRGPG